MARAARIAPPRVDSPMRRALSPVVLAALAALAAPLAGCSLFTVGRGGFGVTGSTDGTVGLSASVELGGGWIDAPRDGAGPRRGEAISLYGGGGMSSRGAEIEAGGRVDYVSLGERTLRIGVRDGVLARPGESALLAIEAAFGMSLAQHDEAQRVVDVGFELRAGPALALDDGAFHWHAMRFYAGVVAERWSIRSHRYDPLDGLFRGDCEKC